MGGHVDLGENVETALRREAAEELGLADLTTERLPHYVFESARERELVFPHRCTYDGEVRHNAETTGGRFWTMEEIRRNMGKGVFTPNFESEFHRLFGQAEETGTAASAKP